MYLLCSTRRKKEVHVDLKWHEGQQWFTFWVNYSFKICEMFGYRRTRLFWRPVFVVVVLSGDEVAKIPHKIPKAKLFCSCFDQTVSCTFLLSLQSRKARKNMWPEVMVTSVSFLIRLDSDSVREKCLYNNRWPENIFYTSIRPSKYLLV